jgi:hypothetical protein
VGDDAVIDSRGGSRRHTTTLTDWCRARDLEPTPQGGDADGDGEVWGGDGKEDEEVEEFTPAEIARQRAVTFVAARRTGIDPADLPPFVAQRRASVGERRASVGGLGGGGGGGGGALPAFPASPAAAASPSTGAVGTENQAHAEAQDAHAAARGKMLWGRASRG